MLPKLAYHLERVLCQSQKRLVDVKSVLDSYRLIDDGEEVKQVQLLNQLQVKAHFSRVANGAWPHAQGNDDGDDKTGTTRCAKCIAMRVQKMCEMFVMCDRVMSIVQNCLRFLSGEFRRYSSSTLVRTTAESSPRTMPLKDIARTQ